VKNYINYSDNVEERVRKGQIVKKCKALSLTVAHLASRRTSAPATAIGAAALPRHGPAGTVRDNLKGRLNLGVCTVFTASQLHTG
jgi:hypothetical protein